MPKKLVSDIYNGHMTNMKEKMGIGNSSSAAGAAPASSAEQAAVESQSAEQPDLSTGEMDASA